MDVRNHEPRTSYCTWQDVIRKKTDVQNNKKASLYNVRSGAVRSGACSTWYVIEKLERQQRDHATHAWSHYWCCLTLGRIAIAPAGGGGGGGAVSCSKP